MIFTNISTKLTGIPVNTLKNKGIPQHAVTYNLLKGISSPKGEFQIISFFDKLGNIIKMCSEYIKNGNKTKLTTCYSPDKTTVNSILEINDEIILKRKKNIQKDYFFTKEVNFINKQYSIHEVGQLKKSEPPKIISYSTAWDGNKPMLNYKNVTKKLTSDKGLELLPLFVASYSDNCIKHLSKYRIREEELENIAPIAKTITLENLTKDSKAARDYLGQKGTISGVTNPVTGEVFIVKGNPDMIDLIDTVAHEYQHVKDASDILRLEDNPKLAQTYFEMLSIQQEPIEKLNPNYKILKQLSYEQSIYNSSCSAGQHDTLLSEQRAIAKGKEQTDLYWFVVNAIRNILSNP